MGVEYMSIVTHRVAPVSNSRGMFVQRKKTPRRTPDPLADSFPIPRRAQCVGVIDKQ